ncbi:tyrosine-type recombinase/integrase [Paramagnetospirillum magneticum]|uniref:Tyr recombinase domain-containing protein n=1 Tax=Paramagnetospirillum magneticum (strain ATCC 700264 / AMB-1) TaxID=342108 RepID=Q2W242_PARM1|nr:tyrosine-type recombinase/integrase [Paramagnetospirillum magneticum]BAE52083.1 hypothetical protein amb3279 [Paramagnetospirillum magneticum AMB-1]
MNAAKPLTRKGNHSKGRKAGVSDLATESLNEFRFIDIPVILRRKQGRSIWTARVTMAPAPGMFAINNDGNRLERTTGESDLERAKDKARQLYAALNYRAERGESLHPKSFNGLVSEYLRWLDERVNLGFVKPYVRARVSTTLERYFVPFFDDKLIDTITAADLVRYHEWRESYAIAYKGKTFIKYERNGKELVRPFTPVTPSPATIRKERQQFYQFMEFSASRGYLRAEAIPRFKRLSGTGSVRLAFSPDEIERLQKVSASRCRKHLHAIQRRAMVINHYRMMVLYLSGLRTVEASRLRFRDLISGVDKAGEISYLVRLRPEHLKKADVRKHLRTVTPQSGFKSIVDNLKKAYAHFDKYEVTEDDFVFHDKDGTMNRNTAKPFIELLDAAKFSRGVRYKSHYALGSFRHTFITDRLYERQDLGFVSRWTGTSIEMIDRHYSHVLNEMEHQEPRPPNTVVVLPHSLEYLLGKADVDPTEEGPTIFNTAKAIEPAFDLDRRRKEWGGDVREFLRIMRDVYGDRFVNLPIDQKLGEIHNFVGEHGFNSVEANDFLVLVIEVLEVESSAVL